MRNDIIFGAVLPYLAFLIARHFGLSTVHALAIGSVFPIAVIVVSYVGSRRLAPVSVITLAATLASLIGSLYFNSAYLALLKNSLITGFIGLVFAGSLLMPRPLVFHFATEKGGEERESGNRLWEVSPPYRALMRRMTIAWAVVLIGEATVRALLIPLLPVDIFLVVSEAMWIVVFAAMISWSWRYGSRKGEEIEARAREGGGG
ncbi:VC0807 family protein [Martelella soudanensis]|uniref:VC0807 family protein n=1 Tax=unclassified Martelella TaxID=2629616 RepID=UPI0015DDC2A8|nr:MULTISPECIES: VC0807 family protein [unclassified Martelella]